LAFAVKPIARSEADSSLPFRLFQAPRDDQHVKRHYRDHTSYNQVFHFYSPHFFVPGELGKARLRLPFPPDAIRARVCQLSSNNFIVFISHRTQASSIDRPTLHSDCLLLCKNCAD
jgi:hypothetical protein